MRIPNPEAAGVPVKARASLAAEQAREPGPEWDRDRAREAAVALVEAGVPGPAKEPVLAREWDRAKAPEVERVLEKAAEGVRADREGAAADRARVAAAANPAVFCSSSWK